MRRVFSILITTFLASNALAQSECLDVRTKTAKDFLNAEAEALRVDRRSTINLLIREIDASIAWDSATGKTRNLGILDGFVNLASGMFRVVPGLGLAMKTKEDSLVYVCLRFANDPRQNMFRVIHFERNSVINSRFQPDPIPLTIAPLGETSLLIDQLFGAGVFADVRGGIRETDQQSRDRRRVTRELDGALNEIIQLFLKTGVQQIDVRPDRVEFVAGLKLLEIIDTTKIPLPNGVVRFESPWLK